MVFSLAMILAPAIGGRVYERFGQDALWIACGILGAVAAGMFWLAGRSLAKDPLPEDTASKDSGPKDIV